MHWEYVTALVDEFAESIFRTMSNLHLTPFAFLLSLGHFQVADLPLAHNISNRRRRVPVKRGQSVNVCKLQLLKGGRLQLAEA